MPAGFKRSEHSDVDLLRPQDVADLLKVSQQTLAQWRWRGEGPRFLKVGRLIRYPRRDLVAWLDRVA